MQFSVYLAFLFSSIKVTETLVHPLASLPRDLEQVFDTYHRIGDLKQQSGELIFWNTMQEYMCKFARSRPKLGDRENRFMRNKMADFMRPFIGSRVSGSRVKRQVVPLRIRREIRMLSREERRRYFDAVNALKLDTRLSPNVYDVLSDFHSMENNVRAHFGPAFPAWHRLFLWIYESFLRLHDPDVTVPFWASVLDNEMDDPTQSVIWSPAFFGNGIGEPVTGPFRNWKSLNPDRVFTRNIGNGPLYSYEGIEAIVNKTDSVHILLPTALADSNFELQHGGPHVFIGGTMISLNTAVYDPVFFNHHAFVDSIWERFRLNQKNNGIDPEADYPFVDNDIRFKSEHGPNETMGFFPNNELDIDYMNVLGYSNAFSDAVQYEPVPSCPDCGGSVYLYCNQDIRRCVSKTIQELGDSSLDPVAFETTGSRLLSPNRVRRTSIHVYKHGTCPRHTLINDIQIKQMVTPVPTRYGQHIYHDWVNIAVKIVSKRASELTSFKSYSLYGLSGKKHRNHKDVLLKTSSQFMNTKCHRNQDVAGKIKIVSYGLNYNGYAEEYVLVDNRLGLAVSYGFVPVRRPTGEPTDVVIAAFDDCGRVCKPFCRAKNQRDVAITGGIRVTNSLPLQYADTYAETMLNAWNINSLDDCPTLDHEHIPLSFFCEYTDPWVWAIGAKKKLTPSLIRKSSGHDGVFVRNPGILNLYNTQNIHGIKVQEAVSGGTNIKIF